MDPLVPNQMRYQTAPHSETGCERLESNQLPPAYETGEMPFLYAAIYLVDRGRIELPPKPCKGLVLPLSLTAQIFINTLFILLYSVCYGEFLGAPQETRTLTPFGAGT